MNHNERLMTDEKQSFFVKLTFIFDPSYIFTSKQKHKNKSAQMTFFVKRE